MPQMAPINWLSLFFCICSILLILITLNYFSLNYSPNKPLNFKKKYFFWKW